MSRSKKRKKRVRRAVERRSSQRQRGLWFIGLGIAVLAVILLLALQPDLLRDKGDTASALAYNPEDVVYDEGLYGVHEMGPSNTVIPFLPKDGPQPKLVIPQDTWDFGRVGPTEVVSHTFVLKNEGEAPLTIARIYTTCGCTTAELTARVIPPGKVALLRLIFDAGYHDVRGQRVRRGVIIESNDPRRSEASVWAEAFVLRK